MTALLPVSLTLDTKLAAAGEQATAFAAMWNAVWTQDTLPPAILELCRLRLAQLHAAPAELAQRNDKVQIAPAKIDALLNGDYLLDPQFSDGERAVLELAEIYAQDPAAISDELAHAIKNHFGEAGLVALVKALGFIDGRIRMARLLSGLINQA